MYMTAFREIFMHREWFAGVSASVSMNGNMYVLTSFVESLCRVPAEDKTPVMTKSQTQWSSCSHSPSGAGCALGEPPGGVVAQNAAEVDGCAVARVLDPEQVRGRVRGRVDLQGGS